MLYATRNIDSDSYRDLKMSTFLQKLLHFGASTRYTRYLTAIVALKNTVQHRLQHTTSTR